MRLMLIPERRAASALAADARMARPYFVRLRNSVNAMTRMGITTMTVSSGPWISRPPTRHDPVKAVG